MKVQDYKKFACFEYENFESKGYQLGDVVYKHPDILSAEKPEIGVVIQTHLDGDFRTDMWGNSSESEVLPATLNEVAVFRPQLLSELDLFVIIETGVDHWGYIVSRPGAKPNLQTIQESRNPVNGYKSHIVQVSEAMTNKKLLGLEYLT
jgi:hypothetical protein